MMGDSEGVRERKVEGCKVITSNSTFPRRDVRWIEGQRGKAGWEGIKPQLQAATARPKLGRPFVELAASSEAWPSDIWRETVRLGEVLARLALARWSSTPAI